MTEDSNEPKNGIRVDIRGAKMNVLLGRAARKAQDKGLEFNITEADFPNFRDPDYKCPFFNIPIVWDHEQEERNSPSVARIDPAKGYVHGNVVLCCLRADLIKGDFTAAQHMEMANRLRNTKQS